MGAIYEVQNVIKLSILMHTNFSNIMHVNTLHFATRGNFSPDATDLQELRDDWNENAATEYLAIFPTSFELYQLDLRAVYGGVPPAESTSYNDNGSRIVAGDYMPPYSCSVLSFKPNIASRRWHGKNFYGGLVEADQVNGSLETAVSTAVGAYAVKMINRFGTAGLSQFVWVVLSDPDHQLPLLENIGDPGITNPNAVGVDSYHVGSFVRTQKRRDFGRGN